ncbi:MAG: DUF2182 domain-containing protein [Candidatus Latescibacteria bacterium]|nr:DUF2182 domain-containing protein [Candidatus Latescibacterota bacterium]
MENPPTQSSMLPWAVALIITALCWLVTIRSVGQMTGDMPMPGGWIMSMAWMPGQPMIGAAVTFLVMWEVMMVAMMLPSAMPMVLLYGRLLEARQARGEPGVPRLVLLAGYFSAWLIFGTVAFAVGSAIAGWSMRAANVSRAIPAATGLALVLAGVYQLTPLKRACLSHCRSPLSFFTTGWRSGWCGTFTLGLHHGTYCTACCWALMLIQLALGIMDVRLMAAVAAIIGLEKSSRYGYRIATGVGVVSIAVGAYLAVRSLLTA